MPRNMSFSLTTKQVTDQTKTVTRRRGWKFLRNGDVLNACIKCMGIPKGETIEVICQIRVIDVRIESLAELILDQEYGQREAAREGFPEMSGPEFVWMFVEHMGGLRDQEVTRIQFEYLQE